MFVAMAAQLYLCFPQATAPERRTEANWAMEVAHARACTSHETFWFLHRYLATTDIASIQTRSRSRCPMTRKTLAVLCLVACSCATPATVAAQEAGLKKPSFDSDGVPIHYVVTGREEGEPVVLIHGFAGSIEREWAQIMVARRHAATATARRIPSSGRRSR